VKFIKKNTIAILVFGVLVILPTSTIANSQKKGDKLDFIVAIVNEDIITRHELDSEIKTVFRQLRQRGTNVPDSAALGKQVLNRLILQRIQLQTAKRGHIQITDETLNRAVENIAKQNKIVIDDFPRVLKREGVDYSAFRERIRNDLVIGRLQQRQVRNRVIVTEQEIKNFLDNQRVQGTASDEYKLGHILVILPEAASAEEIQKARKEAEVLLHQLSEGADFGEIAITTSAGQQALSGGDLGWRKVAQLPIIFANTVFAMKVGDVSALIRSPSGFHIIKLMDKRRNEPQHIVQQTKARHILIKPSSDVSIEQAKTRLQQLKLRIDAGEDFAVLAKAHSQDKTSAKLGGELGWVNPGVMVKEFEKTMNSLSVGKMAGPFQSRFGWHLLQVQQRREHDDTKNFEQNKTRELIRQRKMEPALENWLRRIRDEAFVEVRI
jgi:peptidyl-prolyl cis-trans isomerase SurA